MAQRIFKFRVNTRLLLQLLLFIPVTFLLGYLSKEFIHSWLAGVFIFGISSIGFAFAIKLLHVKSIFRILKYG